MPYFEVGRTARRSVASACRGGRPHVGEIVKVCTDVEEGEEMLAYATRVDATSETPIRVTEARGVTTTLPNALD